MSTKNWADFTPEEDKYLYTEDFNLEKELAETSPMPENLDQTTVQKAVKTFITVEELEKEQFEHLGFTENLPQTTPTGETMEQEIERLKQQVVQEQQRRQKAEDSMGMILLMSKLEMASKAAEARAREEHLVKELEQLRKLHEEGSLGSDSQQRQKEADEMGMTLVLLKLEMASKAEEAKTREEGLVKELDELKTLREKEREESTKVIKLAKEENDQLRHTVDKTKLSLWKQAEGYKSIVQQKETINAALIEKFETALADIKQQMSAFVKQSQEQDLKLQESAQQKVLMVQQLQDKEKRVHDLEEAIDTSMNREIKINLQLQHIQAKLEDVEILNQNLKQEVELEKRKSADLERQNSAILTQCEKLEQRGAAEQATLVKKSIVLELKMKMAQKQCSLQEEKCSALELELKQAREQCTLQHEWSTALVRDLKKENVQRSLLIKQSIVLELKMKMAQKQCSLQEEKCNALEQDLKKENEQRCLQEEECNALELELKKTREQCTLQEERSSALEQDLKKAEEQRTLQEVTTNALELHLKKTQECCAELEDQNTFLADKLLKKYRKKWYRRLICL